MHLQGAPRAGWECGAALRHRQMQQRRLRGQTARWAAWHWNEWLHACPSEQAPLPNNARHPAGKIPLHMPNCLPAGLTLALLEPVPRPLAVPAMSEKQE